MALKLHFGLGERGDDSDDPESIKFNFHVKNYAHAKFEGVTQVDTDSLSVESGAKLVIPTLETLESLSLTGENSQLSLLNLDIVGDVTIDGSGSFLMIDDLKLGGKLSVLNGGVLYSNPTSSTEEHLLKVEAGEVCIDSTSKIDVSGRGYLAGYTKGVDGPTTEGGATTYRGGSYGGIGHSHSSDSVYR